MLGEPFFLRVGRIQCFFNFFPSLKGEIKNEGCIFEPVIFLIFFPSLKGEIKNGTAHFNEKSS
jgi:hypothetical protein